jgi:hypothetical protein
MLASLSFGHVGFSHTENFIVEIADFFVGSVGDYCSKHFMLNLQKKVESIGDYC